LNLVCRFSGFTVLVSPLWSSDTKSSPFSTQNRWHKQLFIDERLRQISPSRFTLINNALQLSECVEREFAEGDNILADQ
jgi:hypothetical protein